jgi:hypothetical protein
MLTRPTPLWLTMLTWLALALFGGVVGATALPPLFTGSVSVPSNGQVGFTTTAQLVPSSSTVVANVTCSAFGWETIGGTPTPLGCVATGGNFGVLGSLETSEGGIESPASSMTLCPNFSCMFSFSSAGQLNAPAISANSVTISTLAPEALCAVSGGSITNCDSNNARSFSVNCTSVGTGLCSGTTTANQCVTGETWPLLTGASNNLEPVIIGDTTPATIGLVNVTGASIGAITATVFYVCR